MQQTILHRRYAPALLFIGLLASGPVLAEKPAWAGGQEQKHGQDNQHAGNSQHNKGRDDKAHGDDRNRGGNADRDGRHPRVGAYFDDRGRTSVRDYYAEQIRAGHCPPGLAKKHNGCRPPGHAKKWKVGHQLPREVIFYNPPPRILTYLGPPPAAHRYVRVANDILLIAIGTGMVIDAIQDLGGN